MKIEENQKDKPGRLLEPGEKMIKKGMSYREVLEA